MNKKIFQNSFLALIFSLSIILIADIPLLAQSSTPAEEITVEDAKKFLKEKLPLWTYYEFGTFISPKNQFSIPQQINLSGSITRSSGVAGRYDYDVYKEPYFSGTFQNQIKIGRVRLKFSDISISEDLTQTSISFYLPSDSFSVIASASVNVTWKKGNRNNFDVEYIKSTDWKVSNNLLETFKLEKTVDLRLVDSFSITKSPIDQSFYIFAESKEKNMLIENLRFKVNRFNPYGDPSSTIYDPEKDSAFDIKTKYSQVSKIQAITNVIGETEGKRLVNALNFLVKAYKKANPEKF